MKEARQMYRSTMTAGKSGVDRVRERNYKMDMRKTFGERVCLLSCL